MAPLMADDPGNVKVVVRCRAFVRREKERGTRCLVRMEPSTQKTTLYAPDEGGPNSRRHEDKEFTFDRSYWSHDEADPHYAHQEDVYRSFGEEFLDHNFEGYHTCIFAYGQTGSGKSYTMMGTPDNPGLIPRTCEELFDRIRHEPRPDTSYHVQVSYFEVYNEHVRDLLTPRTNPPIYLKIRESQKDGVYVQGLTEAEVKSYVDVERLMRLGDSSRTTASTKMNDTSSRSHAVFTIRLKQITHSLLSDETIERTARMRLVDLAGSERAKSTEATGQRLKEGAQINKSLTTLGRVIAALADPRRHAAKGRRPREVVPYRDSVLTWLLRDSLGGNSKTAMVACIAPADYDETLSTLRYADQAKRIRTRASVNQDCMSAAQRDAELSEMAEQIRSLQVSVNAASQRKREEATELEEYQRQVAMMQRLMLENREVSAAKIKALTSEVEEMRPVNVALRAEIDTLRRHLALALGELKNPIVLPPPRELGSPNFEQGEWLEDGETSVPAPSDGEGSDDDSDSGYDEGDHNELAHELQGEAEEFLKTLGLFRKKVGSDVERFGVREMIADLS
ncbi:kinesin-domain-containing protein [Dothidotthia symphoricarpi CBS 119687]|uniref:Kinesin-like protein n=1 Tax=Dothidotthia symphoricarpi CBS 119687 TaxID=1392245 RepID=A0A6A6A3M0_9PLEO|nr:kinesin-domain-containing protein [Dothidotthia symphoricarpi CBS 119687]KAF2126479.1 kinesin-domain-containing protein [Dothidotthia symphoricarpi CBS 119687]